VTTPAQLSLVVPGKPLLEELDVFGLTHPGRVRDSNADHFLIASFHRSMRVLATSLGEGSLPTTTDSRGVLMLVADGVSSLANAEDGSARAIDAIARSLLEMSEITSPTDQAREAQISERMRRFVAQAHDVLLRFAEQEGGEAATTITAALAIWPRAFIAHAGDSRCYHLREGRLQRMTADQTMAQAMIDAGAIQPGSAAASRLGHVLVSALGSSHLDIQLTVTDLQRADRWLLCTDGLTKHVSEAEIGEALSRAAGADSICQHLVDLTLQRGAEDNVTVVVGKLREGV
jgi:protein phosphatase